MLPCPAPSQWIGADLETVYPSVPVVPVREGWRDRFVGLDSSGIRGRQVLAGVPVAGREQP